ncbi:MAG: cardiolipin synthase [Firmicutes bacterium HGW-Firmicutes-5]|nr:MAG: cardiolipin synthase [Firmicutes bacterium HGW-Firmicutes-5]
MKKFFELLTHRIVTFVVAMVLQLIVLVIIISRFNNYSSIFYGVMLFFSFIIVLWLINSKSNPAYKMAWIIPIIALPVFGAVFYWLFGNNGLSKKDRSKLAIIADISQENMPLNTEIMNNLRENDPNGYSQAYYIKGYAFAPPYSQTRSHYFPSGEEMYEVLLRDLRSAKTFIFLEFFIIDIGKMWQGILDILIEKVNEGVDVRVCYDDVGCIMTLPSKYDTYLNARGIRTAVFNPLKLKMSSKYNNRNHRKIVIIDGIIGYTGGCNIADEYINVIEKRGHWKDAAIRLQGDAVWSLTVMFLTMWDYIHHSRSDYNHFNTTALTDQMLPEIGLVQPFSDNPLDLEPVGNHIYLNLINRAEKYIYIKTPYLIIDHGLYTALSLSAKSGVEVIIITPGLGDKWYVHETTRSYYKMLVQEGIQIYEYTPGFIHEKSIVVDDEYAVIGTVNLDYRSMFLHFECGVWLWKTPSINEMKKDFLTTITHCQTVSLENMKKVPLLKTALRAFLRIFSPLM